MCRRAIALVLFKSVLRVSLRHVAHIAVTRDLGEHGGCRNVGALAVTADEAR